MKRGRERGGLDGFRDEFRCLRGDEGTHDAMRRVVGRNGVTVPVW